MSQRDKDNSFIKQEIIGHEFNEKLNDLMYDYFSKRKFESLGFLPRPGAIAMVHTLEENMIKEVGASAPFDIINDNFGKWLAAMLSTQTSGNNNPAFLIGPGQPPIDITNTTQPTVYYYNQGVFSAWNRGSAGTSSVQVGSGVTAPTVSDFNIETPFTNGGLEDTRIMVVGSGGYNPGINRINVGVNIGPTFGGGTINEMALFQFWAGGGTFLMSHDKIFPAVPFVVGQTIFTQYFFQI